MFQALIEKKALAALICITCLVGSVVSQEVSATTNSGLENSQSTGTAVSPTDNGFRSELIEFHGIKYQTLVEGTGQKAFEGDSVWVHYTGWVEADGHVFDSTEERGGSPFEFELGSNRVIPGFNLAVLGMKVGGRRQAVIPPEKGYGNKATGTIPAGATLLFNISLTRVQEPSWMTDPSAPVPGAYDNMDYDDDSPSDATAAPTHYPHPVGNPTQPNDIREGGHVDPSNPLAGSAVESLIAETSALSEKHKMTQLGISPPPPKAPYYLKDSDSDYAASLDVLQLMNNMLNNQTEFRESLKRLTSEDIVSSEIFVHEGAAGRVFTIMALPGSFITLGWLMLKCWKWDYVNRTKNYGRETV